MECTIEFIDQIICSGDMLLNLTRIVPRMLTCDYINKIKKQIAQDVTREIKKQMSYVNKPAPKPGPVKANLSKTKRNHISERNYTPSQNIPKEGNLPANQKKSRRD